MDLDWNHLQRILPRYASSGPRYTSYPPAPVWSETYGVDWFRRALGRARGPFSVYVHVPFCRSLCHFCACNRIITRDPDLPERFLDALEREIRSVRSLLPGDVAVSQIHWGGGTPTHLTPPQIRRLHAALVAELPPTPGAELSIEVDPRVTGEAHVEALRACGFDRISLGVQDVDARVQQAIHRIQPVEQTAALVRGARAAGFRSVGFDLIYGLPFQTEAGFDRTLDAVLALAPDRVALYAYAHVTWVAKQQRGFERVDLPDPPTRLRILLRALRRFAEAGYVHVGMDHFARPEDDLALALREHTLRRNFMGYTTQAGAELIGFGPSAISELGAGYAQSQRDLGAWQAAVHRGDLATLRGHELTPEDRERGWIITQLMCHSEVSAEEFERRFGRELRASYPDALAALVPMEADGLVERDADGSIRVTPLGRLLVRNVAMCFDAYLLALRSGEQPVFSRTV